MQIYAIDFHTWTDLTLKNYTKNNENHFYSLPSSDESALLLTIHFI